MPLFGITELTCTEENAEVSTCKSVTVTDILLMLEPEETPLRTSCSEVLVETVPICEIEETELRSCWSSLVPCGDELPVEP